MTKAIYPGTFDPLTLGHEDIVRRGASAFSEFVVAVSASGRSTLFSNEERVAMVQKALGKIPNVQVISFSGLLVNLCKKHKANVIVRGVRTFADFEYEAEMASLNRQMSPKIDTVYFSTSDALRSISGSRVREIAKLGGPYGAFVSNTIAALIEKKMKSLAPN